MIDLVPYINQLDSSAIVFNNCIVHSLGLVQSDVEFDIAIFFDSENYINKIKDNMRVIFTTYELKEKFQLPSKKAVVVSENPRLLFFKLHNLLSYENENYQRKRYETKIGKDCLISDMSFVEKENVTIGNNVIIEPFATVYKNSIIGDGSVIRSGARIGGQGFEFKRNGNECLAVEHSGGVIIGQNVEIQNNTCIDRAVYPWDDTVIDDFTKVDNLVHIGHGVKVGKCCMVTAGTIIGGRTEVADNVWCGMGSTIKNAIRIGNNCRVNMGAVLISNLKAGKQVSGNYAIDHAKFLSYQSSILLGK